jgi:hypothetical protein
MKHRLAILSVILLMANGMRAETQLADTLREVVVTGARSETDVRLLPLTDCLSMLVCMGIRYIQ